MSNSNSNTKTKKDNMDLTEVYRNHVMRLYNAANWFITPRDFGYIMEREEAHFLSDILNRASLEATNKIKVRENDDWSNQQVRVYFQCSPGYLEHPPYRWDHKTQDRIINSLEEKKYLKRSPRTGIFQGKRWIWVNMDKIVVDLEKHLSDTKDTSEDIFPIGENGGGTFSQSGKIPNGDSKKEDTNVSSYTKKRRKTHCRRPAARADGELGNNGFTQKSPDEKFDEECAERLHDEVKKLAIPHYIQPKLESSIKWFEKLRKLGKDKHAIKEVLDFHLKHLPDKYQPKAYCGESFYQKWNKIVERKSDIEKENIESTPVEVEISSETEEILELLGSARWKDPQALAIAVEKSKVAFSELQDLSYKLKEKLKDKSYLPDDVERAWINDLNENMCANCRFWDPLDFIKYWFELVWEKRANWDEWDWNLDREVFSLDHKRFQNMGRRWATEYGSAALWANLVRRLKEL